MSEHRYKPVLFFLYRAWYMRKLVGYFILHIAIAVIQKWRNVSAPLYKAVFWADNNESIGGDLAICNVIDNRIMDKLYIHTKKSCTR